MGFKDSFTKKAVNFLISFIISTMPKRCFTTQEKSDEFMLTGDGRFSYVPGEKWTCGFGKVSFTPADYESETYYIAGYDSNNPVKGVLDDLYARAVYLDDNRENGGVIFCALDCVGISRKDINDIKKLVLESGRLGKIKSINICATHTHAESQSLYQLHMSCCFLLQLFQHRQLQLPSS